MNELFCFILVWTNPEPLPPLCDLERFPCEVTVDDAREDAKRVDEWIKERGMVGLWDARQMGIACGAQRRCWQPWDYLGEAHDWRNGDHERRHYLARLRNLLGPLDYAQGRMGCPVAWEIFPERD